MERVYALTTIVTLVQHGLAPKWLVGFGEKFKHMLSVF